MTDQTKRRVTLDTLLERGVVDFTSSLRLACHLAKALIPLQQQGKAYLALRPANILVDLQDGTALLVDLHPAQGSHAAVMNDTSWKLDWAYLSPEQTGRMNRTVDCRADFYIFGTVLYRMLTGVLPFDAADPLGWIHCHIAHLPVAPAQRKPSIPQVVSAIVMKLLAKNVDDRYQTAEGLHSDLARCLDEWESTGAISDFTPGQRDKNGQFLPVQKLYGRDDELAASISLFERTSRSREPSMLLLNGPAGIGKSFFVHELVQELQRTDTGQRGLFISSKFEQVNHGIPYAAIAEIFRHAVQHLLTGSEADIAACRKQLLERLGNHGQILINLVPKVERIIGIQPAAPNLPAKEARYRLHEVVDGFLASLIGPERVLVLFLDDLQWADDSSLELMEHIVTESALPCLMVAGAYRDDASESALSRFITHLRSWPSCLEIRLGALSETALNRMVADTLHCSLESARPLAILISGKTGGNPFFAIQLLRKLHEDGYIVFQPDGTGWYWDLERIKEVDVADNLVDLMQQELNRLAPDTREMLQLAACRGTRFSMDELSAIAGCEPARLVELLQPAMDKGLLLSTFTAPYQTYHAFHTYQRGRADWFKWAHDRVQQSLYSAIPASERSKLHLRIGRHLLNASDPQQVPDRLGRSEKSEQLFEIVTQLNAGAALLVDRPEKLRLAKLNLAAGRKAKSSIAYAAALHYLSVGVDLLGSDWEASYETGFPLHRERMECLLLTGNPDDAARLADELLSRARTRQDLVGLFCFKIDMYFRTGKGINLALEEEEKGLALFGMTLPANASREDVVAAALRIRHLLGNREVDALVDLPPMVNDEQGAVMSLRTVSILQDWNRGALHIANMVALSIERGNNDLSARWYANYGICVLGAVLGDLDEAHRYTTAAQALAEKRGLASELPHVRYFHALTSFWTEPVDDAILKFGIATNTATEAVDFNTEFFALSAMLFTMLVRGDALAGVLGLMARAIDTVTKTRAPDWADILTSARQFIRILQGKTHNALSFSDAQFDEDAFESMLGPTRWRSVALHYWTFRLRAHFLFGDFQQALTAAGHGKPLMTSAACPVEMRDFIVFHALTLTALFDKATKEQQAEWAALLEEYQAKLGYWAHINPGTFSHLDAMLSAELARLSGRHQEAARLYEEGIKGACKSHLIPDEALAYELAARFYLTQGFNAFARHYLVKARSGYASWGATGKVEHLDNTYPQLGGRPRVTSMLNRAGDFKQQLDLLAIVKASQAISGEIELDKLLDTVMRAVVENAGAQRGMLLLVHPQHGEATIAARMEAEQVHIHFPQQISVVADTLPQSVLNYVKNSHELVLLDDAGEPNPFSSDPYMASREVKTLLCLPVLRQTNLTGLLYLENNLLTHAFTPDRLAVLQLLASQAAISIENASLFASLQEENLERQRTQKALREHESHIRRLVESNIIAIFYWNPDGSVIDANDAFLRISGFSREDMLGGRVNWHHMTPPEWRWADKRAGKELLQSGTCTPYEKEYIRKDGVRIPILIGGATIEGVHAWGIGFVLDLSSQKQAETERAARKVAEQASEAKSTFVANMSHELRSPLNTILGFGRLIERDPGLAPELKENLDIMLRSGEHLRTLINQVLDLAKIEAGRTTLYETDFDLVHLLEELRDMFALKAQEKGLALSFSIGDVPRIIHGDLIKIRQVLINLLSNALKFTLHGSVSLRVTGNASPSRPRLHFSVRDTGTGIAAAEIPLLFNAFTQSDTGMRTPEGTGLGLTISRSFVKLMGGDIDIDSEPGQGTIVSFYLPTGTMHSEAMAASAGLRKRRVTALAPHQQTYRVLVVDDRADARMLLHKLLTPLGFEVREAADGSQGIAAWKSWRPHLIWMDMRMPVMNGLDATRHIKALAPKEFPVIIALTASSFEDERSQILAAGCDGFLRKPFEEDELLALMKEHLGLEYLYDDDDGAEHPSMPAARKQLASLSADLRTSLEQALIRLDPLAVSDAIAKLPADTLAEGLVAMASEFQYGRMLQLIRESRPVNKA